MSSCDLAKPMMALFLYISILVEGKKKLTRLVENNEINFYHFRQFESFLDQYFLGSSLFNQSNLTKTSSRKNFVGIFEFRCHYTKGLLIYFMCVCVLFCQMDVKLHWQCGFDLFYYPSLFALSLFYRLIFDIFIGICNLACSGTGNDKKEEEKIRSN